MSQTRRIAQLEAPSQSDAISYLNCLIIDLKLQLLGQEPSEPITIERLNEWSATHRGDLERCKVDLTAKHLASLLRRWRNHQRAGVCRSTVGQMLAVPAPLARAKKEREL